MPRRNRNALVESRRRAAKRGKPKAVGGKPGDRPRPRPPENIERPPDR